MITNAGDTAKGKEMTDYKNHKKGTTAKKENEKRCPVSARCGGCRYINLPYAEQLKKKQKTLQELLAEFGKMEPIVGMENPLHYRNKVHAVYDFQKGKGIVSGIYQEGSHDVVPVDSCLIENEKADEIIVSIRELAKSFKIKTYDEDTGYGLLRHVLVRTAHATGQIMVVMVLGSPILPSKKNFVNALCKLHPEITTIVINVNNKRTSMVLGDKEQIIYGKGYIEDVLCGKTFRISPKSFYQVNPVQTEKLYSLALSYAGLSGKESVWDLYCGIGTISLFLSGRASKVYGVEVVPQAIEDAKQNAANNGITNAEFFVGKAEEVLPEFYGRKDAVSHSAGSAEQGTEGMLHPDVIVVDPPRKGCDGMCLDTMLKMAPDRIVYVSCDSATLARDLRILCDGGYELKRIRPVDMFPQTVHVETVVLMTRK